MTFDRFAALANAYGGSIERWPASERHAARAYLEASPEAHALLAQAAWLDATLASWTVPGPGAALAARITTAATRQHARRRRLLLWLSGLGTATTLAGGLATGAGLVALPAPRADSSTFSLYQLSVLGAPLELGDPSAKGDGS